MSKRARLFVLPQEWLVIERFFQSAADSMVSGLNVPRVGLTNGALRQLEKDIATISTISEREACNFVAEVVDHLVDGNIFSRVGERKDREPIGILQQNCLLEALEVVRIEKRTAKAVPKSVFKKIRDFWTATPSATSLSEVLRRMKYAQDGAECNRWVHRFKILELFANIGTPREPVWIRTLPGFEKFTFQIVEDDTRHSYLKDEKSRSKKRRRQDDTVAVPVKAASDVIKVQPIKETRFLSTDSIVAYLTKRLRSLESEKSAIAAARDEFQRMKLRIDDLLRDGRTLDAEAVSAYNETKNLLDKSQMSDGERQALMSAYSKVMFDLDGWVSTDSPPAEVRPRVVITPSVMLEIAATDKFKNLSGAGKIAVITVGSPFAETGFSSSQMIHYIVEKGMKFWEKRDFHSFLTAACQSGKKRQAFFLKSGIPIDGRVQAKENCGRKVAFCFQLTDAGREFARQFLESLNK